MMEAFSNAREYCAVGLWVNASNLDTSKKVVSEAYSL